MNNGMSIPAPIFPRLLVTLDPWGGGTNDAGIEYVTYDIYRPATATRGATLLASITLYADGTPALVWDRYTGDARPGDLKAIQAVRDVLARDYPDARANSYRLTIV
jgi:hypothetical protein